jgi:hypothetical protein
MAQADTLLESSRKFIHRSRLRGGNLTLIFLIAAHSNHFSSCSMHFSRALDSFLRNNIQVFAFVGLSLSHGVIFCKFKLSGKEAWVFIPTGASAEQQIKSSVIIMADQFL